MNEKIFNIINLLYELDKQLSNNEVKKKPLITRGKKSYSKEEFKEHLKLSFKGENREFTQKIKNESDSDKLNYNVIFRKKENRYMGYFYFLGEQFCKYGKTKTEAMKNIRVRGKEVLSEHKEISSDNKNNLNTWFDYWIENIKKPQVKESTYLQLLELYKRYVIDKIGKESIKKINSQKLQTFINQIPSHDAKRKVNTILKNIFDMLLKQGKIKLDLMSLVVLPKKYDETVIDREIEVSILKYEDELILLEAIRNSQCYHAVKFILYSGLRRGELLGLQWKHIDLKKYEINIKQQFNYDSKKITTPKTKAAIRTIPLLPEAIETLNELRNNSNKLEDFVFNGVNRLTQQLVYFSKKLGFKVSPHLLRHTFASRCYFTGLNPKIIQTILGHETIDTTLNTYTHVLDYKDKEIINQMKEHFIKIKLIY